MDIWNKWHMYEGKRDVKEREKGGGIRVMEKQAYGSQELFIK